MQTKFQMTKAEFLRAGKRGNSQQKPQVLVEGKYVTYDDMAARIGLNKEQARSRYSHHRRSGRWPITWEMMEGK